MKKSLLTLAFLSVTLLSMADVYLVSVGVADYPGTENDLSLPVKDAQAITWLYSKNSNLNYVQLVNSQATAAKIKSAMDQVYAKAGRNDIVVFFYSGHGYEGGLFVFDGPMDYQVIRSSMSKSKCRNKMIFADACFSGKFRTPGHSSGSSSSSSNVMLFLSSRSNETSIENRNMRNGFFTTFLERGLRGGADANRDRIITARELFDFVNPGVVQLSDGKQHPVMWGNFPDNMCVMSWK